MKKNRLLSFLIICMMSMVVTACSKKEEAVETVEETEEVNMFGLTEKEQKLYAEYAAGVLMKYNAGTNTRVLEGQKLAYVEEKEEAKRQQEARREQLVQEYQSGKNTDSSNKNTNSSASNGTGSSSGVSYINDMATAGGMNDFSINYIGCEITESYPNAGDDIFMAMDATDGKVLVVTKFAVTNKTNDTQNFNMFSNKGKFKLKLNGKTYKSQYTLLLDDLSMYKGDVGAGETIETVLVFEVPQEYAQNTEGMELAITIGGSSSTMSLSGNASNMSVFEQDNTVVEADTDVEAFEDTEEVETEDVTANEQGETQSDLAQEYMEALEALEGTEDSNSGNVTVVGSNRNL